MKATLDMPALERRAYETLWADGLVDIFAALGLLALGVAWVLDQVALGSFAPVLMIPIWASTRKRFTEPRAGYVRFSAERQSLQRRHLGALVLLGTVTLGLGVVVYLRQRGGPSASRDPSELLRTVVPALPAALLGLGALLIGALFGIRRFFFHAALLVAAGALGIWFELEPGWHFLIAGPVILAVGVAVLVGFLRRNPLPDEGDPT